MGCPFCATGQGGLKRNLSTAEIVAQVQAGARYAAQGLLPEGPTRLSNIVFMGMGEPMANFNAVVGTIHRIHDESPEGLGISARNITVSTVGLVPRINDLAALGLPVRLAVSLHAPTDELRDTLVPINERYPIKQVLDASWKYAETSGRRVSIEYAMIKSMNDQIIHAKQLANLLRGKDVHVNLIPLNPTPGSKWTASEPEDEKTFVEILEQSDIAVTVRDTRGREIDGACGQLAASEV
jgi:23S rRNA (adenine2503-C2)-methyltransferase